MIVTFRALSFAIFFSLGIGFFPAVKAQELPVAPSAPFFIRSWQVGQGLPSSAVNAITQTHDGYLWLGTDEGLARFDGVKCRVYGLQDGLKNLQISALMEDRHGVLWIGTAGGGLGKLIDGKIETFTSKDGLAGDSINAFLESTNGDVWIGTHTGLSRWHGGKFETPDKTLGSAFIFDLAKDHEGDIWVATLHNGLQRFHDGKFSVVDGESGTFTNNPRCLLVDSQDRVWAGLREKTLLCWENGKITRYGTNEGFPEVILNRLAQTQDGTVWAGSLDEGLFYLSNGQFKALKRRDGLPDDSVLSLFADREHLLWIGTQSGGLSRLGQKRLLIYHVMDGDGTSECVLRSLAKTTNGDLWVGTFGEGIYRWQGNQFEHDNLGSPDKFPTRLLVEAMLGTSDGSLWCGAASHLYQLKDGKIIYNANENWAAGDRIWCLSEAPDGGIWIGTFNGQLELLKNRKLTAIKGLGGKPVTSLAQNPDGSLWIGSLGGGIFKLADGKLTSFTAKDGLKSDLIRTLLLDVDGTLWIGTDGGGLTRFANGQFKTFTMKQGLISDTVLQILSDNDGSLWLGCSQGICRISKRAIDDVVDGMTHALHPLVFSTTEGMPSEECVGNFGAALKTDDNQLCFSTTKGIVVLDPQRQLARMPLPEVLMQEVLMDGQPLTPLSKTDDAGLPVFQTPSGRHNFEFHYTAFSFDAPERVRFKYFVEGLDPYWIEAGSERVARYNIPPGTYHFRVIACNSNGLWNEVGAGITLVIPPNLWQTPWFWILTVLILLALVVFLVRLIERRRFRARLKRLEQEQAMEKERARIARDLHDELGSSLTYISMLSDLSQLNTENADRLEKLEKRVQKISTSAVCTVRSLDEIVWAVNPGNDSLRSLLAYLTQFAREQFEDTDVNCRFKIPNELPELLLPPEMRHNIFLTVKEALNNAQKHAHASEVCLGATTTSSQVEISVQDNGLGFDLDLATTQQKRNGLSNMRQRIESLGGRLVIETKSGQGTTVRLMVNGSFNLHEIK